MDQYQAVAEWNKVRDVYERAGLALPDVTMFTPEEWKSSDRSLSDLAMDAAAGTLSTSQNAALPAILTTSIDPDIIRVIFAPLAMAEILGEERRVGSWTDQQRIFPVVEDTGEVSSYGDYASGGRAGINFNYPQFQSYLFQTIVRYGELETARAGLMRINYVGDLTKAVANLLNRFGNLTYAFGVNLLQCYGIINNPFLSAYQTPAVKAWGGTTWFNGSAPAATANEVYNDIVALVTQLISQLNGALQIDAPMTLAIPSTLQTALSFTNSFGVTVRAMLKESYPNIKVKNAPQYGAKTTTNPQGYSSAGNVIQLMADELDGQQVRYGAFNEKMRAHKIVPETSSWKQKYTSGTWGAILCIPPACAGMLGV